MGNNLTFDSSSVPVNVKENNLKFFTTASLTAARNVGYTLLHKAH